MLDQQMRYGLRIQIDSAVRRNLGLAERRSARHKPGNFQSRWTNEEIRAKIRAVAAALGREKITQSEYKRFVEGVDDRTQYPSWVTTRRCRDEFAR